MANDQAPDVPAPPGYDAQSDQISSDKQKPSDTVDVYDDVAEFHGKFGLPFGIKPRELTAHEHAFRVKFMKEELQEYEEAVEEGDLAKQFDALIDLLYVVVGTILWHRFPFKEGWRRVHAANMAKVRVLSAKASKRTSKYDVIKPEGWTAPDLSDLVS
jgi:predicted HAD superfamily Cof-like phosphohydrolase